MDETFKVTTLFNCHQVDVVEPLHQFNPMWRQNALSCRVLLILQQMYNFHIIFNIQELKTNVTIGRDLTSSPHINISTDINLELMAITNELIDNASPVESVFVWRFGFILRREYTTMLQPYYSLPFARHVWLCILGMILLVTVIFYVVRRWEKVMIAHLECNLIYEFYATIGVVCQHFFPPPSYLWSRRMAYFFFVIFAYLTHAFYTSNLLSYIVTDKEGSMDIKALAHSDYKLIILENIKLATERRVTSIDRGMNKIESKLTRTNAVNITAGLEAVRTTKTALLCDYATVYSTIARTFDNEDICELEEVDVFSNVRMYLFVAKQFRYTEQLKIGILRMKEAGIIKRLIYNDEFSPLRCVTNVIYNRSQFDHIITPLLVIFVFYIFACLILIAEILYYDTHKTWPYVN